MAMSSTRVMATCALCGQAVGTAAALAVRYACSPRAVGEHHLAELQENLMDDDAYLPWHSRAVPELTRLARLEAETGEAEALRSGVDRILGAADNGWWAAAGQSAGYRFEGPRRLSQARFTFDSDLAQVKRMPCWYPLEGNQVEMPAPLARDFDLEVLDGGGVWRTAAQVRDNAKRLVRLPLELEAAGARLKILRAWGGERAHVMAFDVR